MALWPIVAIWQLFLFSDFKYRHSDMGVYLGHMHTYIGTLIHAYIHIYLCMCGTYIPKCIHSYMYAWTHMSTYMHAYLLGWNIYVCIYKYRLRDAYMCVWANMHACTVACLATYIHANIHGDSCTTETDKQMLTLTLVCLHTYMHKYIHTSIKTDIHVSVYK